VLGYSPWCTKSPETSHTAAGVLIAGAAVASLMYEEDRSIEEITVLPNITDMNIIRGQRKGGKTSRRT
jgi:hypothetical protein